MVKKRGSPIEPETLARQLRGPGSGSAVVVVTRVAGAPTVLVCDPLSGDDAPHLEEADGPRATTVLVHDTRRRDDAGRAGRPGPVAASGSDFASCRRPARRAGVGSGDVGPADRAALPLVLLLARDQPVGWVQRSWAGCRPAAFPWPVVAGILVCLGETLGYYGTSALRGFGVGATMIVWLSPHFPARSSAQPGACGGTRSGAGPRSERRCSPPSSSPRCRRLRVVNGYGGRGIVASGVALAVGLGDRPSGGAVWPSCLLTVAVGAGELALVSLL